MFKTNNKPSLVVGPRLIDGRGFSGVLGGLITFLAARLTRYSLGLAATLLNVNRSPIRSSNSPVLWWENRHLYSVRLPVLRVLTGHGVHSKLGYPKNWRHTKREMAITKWVKVCIQWSSNGCGVKQFCRVLPKSWCHALSICWRNIMTFNDGFIHWNK